MMTSRHLILLALALPVAACAPLAAKQPAPRPEPAAASPAVAPTAVPAGAPALPPVTLSEDILYQFLLAEIAGQRGDLGLATEAYLDLAETTRDPRLAQRATEIALYARREQQALQAASLWYELAPKSPQALQAVGVLLINRGQLAEARPYFERFLAGDGTSRGQAFLHLGGLLARQKNRAAALELMQDLAKPYADLAEARFAVAQAAWNANRPDLALEEIVAARALRPDWELAALFQGKLLEQISPSRALEFYRDFLGARPKAGEVRLAYARALANGKHYEPAREQFGLLLDEFPDNADISFAVGVLSLQLEYFEAAQAHLLRALELGYKDGDLVRLTLGQLGEERKRFEEAVKWYGSVTSSEHYLGAQIRLAGVLAKQGKLAEARRHLQQLAGQNDQQRVQLIQAEAQLLQEANARQEAYDLLGSTLEKLPNHPDLLYDHAMAAEKINRLDVMERDLRKLIQLRPDHAHAYNALGYALADRAERLQEAHDLLETALKLAPDDAFIMDSMGWLHYRLGEYRTAVDYLRRAFASRPDPEIAAHLGEVLWVQGERGEAEMVWQSALKSHPRNELLQSVIKKFKP